MRLTMSEKVHWGILSTAKIAVTKVVAAMQLSPWCEITSIEPVFSVQPLCALCLWLIIIPEKTTIETQSTQRLHREGCQLQK
jgi:hypothetical protein